MTDIRAEDVPEKEIAAYLLRIFSTPESGINVPSSQVEMMTVAKQWLLRQVEKEESGDNQKDK